MTDLGLSSEQESAVLDFLARAIPALVASGMQPATLDLLDSINQHPRAYNDIAARANLTDLAVEWAGLRAHAIEALELQPDGAIEFGFRVFASDETEHWNLAGTPLAGARCFGLYLIREGERTYCCSLTPSSWAEALQNVFAYPDDSDAPRDPAGRTPAEAYRETENLEYEAVEPCYLGFMGERADLEKRHVECGDISERLAIEQNGLRVDLRALGEHAASPGDPRQSDPLADIETARAAFYKLAAETAWEDAREYAQGNCLEPRCVAEAFAHEAA